VEGDRDKLLAWLGVRILPHEAEVRAWLYRALNNPSDVEDVIQEAYCRLWSISDVSQIASPRAYFFKVVRHVVIDELRRSRVVRIETMAEIDDLRLASEEATPERAASAREELRKVRRLIEALPLRCRRIFEMRKIEGMSQREIAAKLGVSENVVENEASRGLKLILKAVEEDAGLPRSERALRREGGRRGQRKDR